MKGRTPDMGMLLSQTNRTIALVVGVGLTVTGSVGLALMEPQITAAATGYPGEAGPVLGWTALIFVGIIVAGIPLIAYSVVSLQRPRSKVKTGTPGSEAA